MLLNISAKIRGRFCRVVGYRAGELVGRGESGAAIDCGVDPVWSSRGAHGLVRVPVPPVPPKTLRVALRVMSQCVVREHVELGRVETDVDPVGRPGPDSTFFRRGALDV